MKKRTALLLCSILAVMLHAQQSYDKVDSTVRDFKEEYTDASDLARKLTLHFQTDREKARAIFDWVAFNIRYDYKKYKDPPPRPRITGIDKQDLQKNIRAWEEKEIHATLRDKKGVCADYSNLVKEMCDAADLECVFIPGVSRTLRGRGGSHAWNAVKFNGIWHLLDATWGAGYMDYESERFVRRFTPGFFDTSPSFFALSHFPDEAQWQLLDKPLSKEEFRKQPVINFSNPDFPIEAFQPENGRLVSVDNKAEIRLKLTVIPEVFIVVAGKDHEIPLEVKTTDDGWAVLTFSPGGASKISVYAGKSYRSTSILVEFTSE